MKRFTDRYLDYAKDFTDCPDVFLTWGALLAISSVLSRQVYVEIGSWNIAPHLWMILIGKSSSHKSTAISIVENLVEDISPDRLASHEFSSEAIIKSLSENPNRLFVFDEAKSFFDSMSKSYNESLKSLFTILYRKPNYTRTTLKHGTVSISGAYMPIGMATTPEWLRSSLQDAQEAALSGFLARFLMVPYLGVGNRPIARPKPHSVEKYESLRETLRGFGRIARPYAYTPEADAYLEKWYCDTTDRENDSLPVLGPFFEHIKNEAVHKLAVIMAIDRGEDAITLPGLQEACMALSYIEDQLPAMVMDITDNKMERNRKRIAQYIQSVRVCKREDVADRLHVHGEELSRHLQGLEADGFISISKVPTARRPKTEIRWEKGE